MSGAKIVGFCITTLPVFGSKAQLRGSHAILEVDVMSIVSFGHNGGQGPGSSLELLWTVTA